MPDYGLGRIPAVDARDRQHLMRGLLAPPVAITGARYWSPGPVLDQGAKPECVGYGWRGWLTASPIRTRTVQPLPSEIYRQAQLVDEWDGQDYDGTSVRAGAKVIAALGHIQRYLWAGHELDVRQWIHQEGPVVMGTNWYGSMFEPDRSGMVHIEGQIAGGHCYLITGHSALRRAYRCQNSWGTIWGQQGRFWLAEDDLARLLTEQGEACAAIQQVLP